MIIIEGPDGAGKTNLAERIHRRFGIPLAGRASHSTRGPVTELCKWVDRDLLTWGNKRLMIYDRYPLISEPIYGTLCRGSLEASFTTSWMRARINLFRNLSAVIWCLPPLDAVISNVQAADQMPGVRDNIKAIWHMYACTANSWPGPGMVYDYTNENPDPMHTQLVNVVRKQMNTWGTYV